MPCTAATERPEPEKRLGDRRRRSKATGEFVSHPYNNMLPNNNIIIVFLSRPLSVL